MSVEVNPAIARRYYSEILTQGNLEAIAELIAPDFRCQSPTYPKPFNGLEGCQQLVTQLHQACPNICFTVEHLVVEGETVVSHWTQTGTHTGAALPTVMGEIPATGKSFRIDGMGWLRIVNGKLVECLTNEDTLGLLTQLGLLPQPEAPTFATNPAENQTLVDRYFNEILSQGKLEVIDEIIAPDFCLRIPGLHEPFYGPEGMKQFVTGLRTSFPDIQFTVERQIAAGDQVASRFQSLSTHQAEFIGIPATGNPVEDRGVDIFRIANGKIAEVWVNEHALGVLQQIGMFSQ